MKDQRFKSYIYWGVTAACVIAACVMLVFFLFNLERVEVFFTILMKILTPIIYGAVLAYLLTPIYNKCVAIFTPALLKLTKKEKISASLARCIGTAVSLVVIVVVVVGLISMLLPELITSIMGVVETLPGNLENFSKWLQQRLADNPEMEQTVLAAYNKGIVVLQNWLTTDLMPNLDKVITGVSSGLVSVVNLLKNILIGLIVMVYLLNIKALFCAQGKKAVYSIFPVKNAKLVIDELRYIHKVFGGFIIGKLLDSLIIGIMCFVLLSWMKMPYVLLVSVIVGVTNIIPFFGPFIGAIPSAVLIILVSPMKCLYFLVFILLLQQFDGNILGPKILGDSTGLSSFWVLFSILLFGGLFGFVGMIIGVPTFAVIYDLVSKWIKRNLVKKNLPLVTKEYMDLDYIDENNKTYQK